MQVAFRKTQLGRREAGHGRQTQEYSLGDCFVHLSSTHKYSISIFFVLFFFLMMYLNNIIILSLWGVSPKLSADTLQSGILWGYTDRVHLVCNQLLGCLQRCFQNRQWTYIVLASPTSDSGLFTTTFTIRIPPTYMIGLPIGFMSELSTLLYVIDLRNFQASHSMFQA